MPAKTIIFLGDGMADDPATCGADRTPLQTAHTPAMDTIARDGVSGTLLTLPRGFPTSSEVANMSVLGCDLAGEYCGRGPLEATGRGIDLAPDDLAFRINLTTVENGILRDYSGGQVPQHIANRLIPLLNDRFGSDSIRFFSGVSYRNLLILSGKGFSDGVATEKPDDNVGNPLSEHLPRALKPESEPTALFLRKLVMESTDLLEQAEPNRALAAAGKPMANSVWPWFGGYARPMRQMADKYGITGAVISAVDVILGIGRSIGMDVIHVPGATGYIDTNYEGKADAAIKAIRDHDLVYVHVEAIDEVSHLRNRELKIRTIEDFDSRLIGRVMAAVGPDIALAVLPDHPVPLASGRHTRTPVPVAVRIPGRQPDRVTCYDEVTCLRGELGQMAQGGLMTLLFGAPRS